MELGGICLGRPVQDVIPILTFRVGFQIALRGLSSPGEMAATAVHEEKVRGVFVFREGGARSSANAVSPVDARAGNLIPLVANFVDRVTFETLPGHRGG